MPAPGPQMKTGCLRPLAPSVVGRTTQALRLGPVLWVTVVANGPSASTLLTGGSVPPVGGGVPVLPCRVRLETV